MMDLPQPGVALSHVGELVHLREQLG